jgi:hypothetical protein
VLPNQILWDDLSHCQVPTDRVYSALETVEEFDHRFDFYLVQLHREFHIISSNFLVHGVRLGTAVNTVAEWSLRRLSHGQELPYLDGLASRASVARLDYEEHEGTERSLCSHRLFDLEIRANIHVSYSIEPMAK